MERDRLGLGARECSGMCSGEVFGNYECIAFVERDL